MQCPQMGDDTPRFGSFPQLGHVESNSNTAGPSRRPAPSFSSYPVPAGPSPQSKRVRDESLEGQQKHRKHRHREVSVGSHASHKSAKPAKCLKNRKHPDVPRSGEAKHTSWQERGTTVDPEALALASWGRRYSPVGHGPSDTVSIVDVRGLFYTDTRTLDASKLLSRYRW